MSNYQNITQLTSSGLFNVAHEVLHVKSKKISCDGSKTSSSHPLVYLNMGDNDYVVCPYCSKYFTINPSYPNTQNSQKNKIKN